MRDKTPKSLVPVIIGVVVALSVATGVVWSKKMDDKPTKQAVTAQNQQAANTQKDSTRDDSIAYDGIEGKTALELLKTKAHVVTKDSAYGEYVDSINGTQGGTDGKYWAFYINGQMAQEGAGTYQTKSGDKIEWKFE